MLQLNYIVGWMISAKEKIEQDKSIKVGDMAILWRVIRVGFNEMTSEQRLAGGRKVISVNI